MSVVSIPEIQALIKSNYPSWIIDAKKKHKKLDVLINGNNVPQYLAKVEGYENESQYKLRKKFSGTTKHVFSDIARPIDKVFTARGGSKIYGANSDTSRQLLVSHLNDVEGGYSITDWIKSVQLNKYLTDPAGLVFFEWGNDENNPYTTPTIKSISEIKNYEQCGRSIEWVLFEGEKRKDDQGRELKGIYYRFVDDAFDYTFVQDGENISLIEDETYINPWGKVPGIINSEMLNDSLEYHDSPFDVVVDLGDKYLRGQSTRNIYEQLLMYPAFWMYAQPCESCKGTGEIKGDTCSTCNGSKKSMKRDVSDVILLNPPSSNDDPTIAPDVAGFSQPELEPFRESREELEWIQRVMTYSVWGSSKETAENKTATAAFLDLQPVNDRQGQFSDSFEDLEKRMTDFIGEFYLQTSYNPDNTSINYGRIYLMQPPEQLLENYTNSRDKGAPQVVLDHLLKQYYQSEFMNDPISLSEAMKAMGLEPFLHKSAEQVKALQVIQRDYYSKVYFNDWWVNVDPTDKRMKTKEQLNEDFETFLNSKLDQNEASQHIQTENPSGAAED
jgi:hypothetical protein